MINILNIINKNKIGKSFWPARRIFLRWEMDYLDISPEEFINTIVFITHKNYSSDRKYIKRWRIIKLILKIADEINYHKISSGFYKHGNYSFAVDSFLRTELKFTSSLNGVKIKNDLINKEFSEIILPAIEQNKTLFIQPTIDFRTWAHVDQPPKEYQNFYFYSDRLLDGFNDISRARSRQDIREIGDEISDIITYFDPCLTHVDKNILNIYFDFTDTLENVFSVISHRNITREAKPILINLYEIYYNYIFSFFPPFKQTLHGDNIENELINYSGALTYAGSKIEQEYPRLKKRIKRKNLIPTIDELTSDIENEITQLNTDEKHKIVSLFSHIP